MVLTRTYLIRKQIHIWQCIFQKMICQVKLKIKAALQERVGLPVREDVPLVGIVLV